MTDDPLEDHPLTPGAPAEAPSRRSSSTGRVESLAALALSAVPGWLVVAGVVWEVFPQMPRPAAVGAVGGIAGFSDLSGAPFFASAVAAILLWRATELLARWREWPEPEGGDITWFSGISELLWVSANHLRHHAARVGIPARPVLVVVWLPWWAMCGAWVMLAVASFASLFGLL